MKVEVIEVFQATYGRVREFGISTCKIDALALSREGAIRLASIKVQKDGACMPDSIRVEQHTAIRLEDGRVFLLLHPRACCQINSPEQAFQEPPEAAIVVDKNAATFLVTTMVKKVVIWDGTGDLPTPYSTQVALRDDNNRCYLLETSLQARNVEN